jgi:hypothetical protein
MSTDRELLELAAKAAGVDGKWARRRFGNASDWSEYFVVGPRVGKVWNPLADDGDALRLAVKLQISIDPQATLTAAASNLSGDYYEEQASDFGGDLNAATRRAVVRAAAEIARHATK